MDPSAPLLDYAPRQKQFWPKWLTRGRLAVLLMLAVVFGYLLLTPRYGAMVSTVGVSTQAGKVLLNGSPVACDTDIFAFNDYDNLISRSDIDRIFRDTEWILTRKIGPPTAKQIRHRLRYPILVHEWTIGGQYVTLTASQDNDGQGIRLEVRTTPAFCDLDPAPRAIRPGENVLTVLEREANFAGYCGPALAGGLILAIGMMWYLLGLRSH